MRISECVCVCVCVSWCAVKACCNVLPVRIRAPLYLKPSQIALSAESSKRARASVLVSGENKKKIILFPFLVREPARPPSAKWSRNVSSRRPHSTPSAGVLKSGGSRKLNQILKKYNNNHRRVIVCATQRECACVYKCVVVCAGEQYRGLWCFFIIEEDDYLRFIVFFLINTSTHNLTVFFHNKI